MSHRILLQPTPPHFHIGTAPESIPGATVGILHGSACTTEAGLFAAFSRALSFPDYFGRNWDALDECLTDLEWLPTRHVVVVFQEATRVLEAEPEGLDILLEILSTTAEAWGQASSEAIPMSFHVVLEGNLEDLRNWTELLEEMDTPWISHP